MGSIIFNAKHIKYLMWINRLRQRYCNRSFFGYWVNWFGHPKSYLAIFVKLTPRSKMFLNKLKFPSCFKRINNPNLIIHSIKWLRDQKPSLKNYQSKWSFHSVLTFIIASHLSLASSATLFRLASFFFTNSIGIPIIPILRIHNLHSSDKNMINLS